MLQEADPPQLRGKMTPEQKAESKGKLGQEMEKKLGKVAQNEVKFRRTEEQSTHDV